MTTSPPLQEEDPKAPAPTCHFLTATPLEIRLEIYKYLLVLDLQPPQSRSSPTTKQHHLPEDKATTTTTTTTTNWKPQRPRPLLHPPILRVSRQIHHEALPLLYQSNTFLAHETNLTMSPSLFLPPPKISPSQSYTYKSPHPYLLSRSATPISVSLSLSPQPEPKPNPNPNIHLIRKWRIRVRLDSGFPPWQRDEVARAFSGVEELTLCVYRAMFVGGVGVDVLRRFEGVRGVRKATISGCLAGFEGYVRWLESSMMRDIGDDGDEKTNGNEDGKEEVFMVGGYRCADALERKRLTGWVC